MFSLALGGQSESQQSTQEECNELNLTPAGVLNKYFNSFTAVLMPAIWIKVLVPIDSANKILQTRKITIDDEERNSEESLRST